MPRSGEFTMGGIACNCCLTILLLCPSIHPSCQGSQARCSWWLPPCCYDLHLVGFWFSDCTPAQVGKFRARAVLLCFQAANSPTGFASQSALELPTRPIHKGRRRLVSLNIWFSCLLPNDFGLLNAQLEQNVSEDWKVWSAPICCLTELL